VAAPEALQVVAVPEALQVVAAPEALRVVVEVAMVVTTQNSPSAEGEQRIARQPGAAMKRIGSW
jgi:hypothetical protein